jgi:NTE family protein
MGIPTMFTPYRINDKILMDGGVARSIPASEVREMGADFVISVNVTKHLKPVDSLRSLTSIMNQVISIHDNRDFQHQLEFTDLLIEPDVANFSISDFKHADELIELGKAATRLHSKTLNRLSEDTVRKSEDQERSDPPPMNARKFSEIEIRGLQEISRELVMQTFDLPLYKDLRHSEIQIAIEELYNTQFFSLVTYQTQPLPDGTHKLILNISEKNQDQFKLGIRYDTDTQVSLISQLSFRNLFHTGSLVRLEARLGEITSFSGEYTVFRGLRPRMGIRSLVNYQRKNLHWHHSDNQITPFVSHHITGELSTGNFFSNRLLMSGGIRKELLYLDHTSNLPFSRNQSYHTLFGRVWHDTFDHLSFPTEGQMMLGEITFSDDLFYSPLDYSHQHFYWSAALPLLNDLTVKPEFRVGRSTGRQLPASEWFYLQRMDPLLGQLQFMGYRNREVHGRNLQLAGLGVQWEIMENKFVKLQSQIGNTFNHWPWDPWNHKYKRGIGVSMGAKTFAGPLELTISSSQRHPLLVYFQMGYSF